MLAADPVVGDESHGGVVRRPDLSVAQLVAPRRHGGGHEQGGGRLVCGGSRRREASNWLFMPSGATLFVENYCQHRRSQPQLISKNSLQLSRHKSLWWWWLFLGLPGFWENVRQFHACAFLFFFLI